jgi:uncharacterized membrane protein (DUF485 family)
MVTIKEIDQRRPNDWLLSSVLVGAFFLRLAITITRARTMMAARTAPPTATRMISGIRLVVFDFCVTSISVLEEEEKGIN